MLSIRLSRTGKKHQPSYRIIVCDKQKDPWGNYLEKLGIYNPMVKPKVVQCKEERVKYWLSVGAQPTATVWNLLVAKKIVEGSKRKKHSTGKKKTAAQAQQPEKQTTQKTDGNDIAEKKEQAPEQTVANAAEGPGKEQAPV